MIDVNFFVFAQGFICPVNLMGTLPWMSLSYIVIRRTRHDYKMFELPNGSW